MPKYSLANYILSIESDNQTLRDMFGSISIGGEGSMLGSITISLANNLWTTASYPTGGWVHSKNLSRVGTIELTINMLSDSTSRFKKMVGVYYTGDYGSFTLSISDNEGNELVSAIDCLPQNYASLSLTESPQDQTWTFTCGQIIYK